MQEIFSMKNSSQRDRGGLKREFFIHDVIFKGPNKRFKKFQSKNSTYGHPTCFRNEKECLWLFFMYIKIKQHVPCAHNLLLFVWFKTLKEGRKKNNKFMCMRKYAEISWEIMFLYNILLYYSNSINVNENYDYSRVEIF